MVERVKFDFRKVTARQMSEVFRAARENDMTGMAEIFAKIVVECPPEWGNPNDPGTYLDLPYYGEDGFLGLLRHFTSESQSAAKN